MLAEKANMLRRHPGASNKEVRVDAVGSSVDDGLDHTRQNQQPLRFGRECLAPMLTQFIALFSFCLAYIYVISFALSYSSINGLRSTNPVPSPSVSSIQLSLAAARKLPSNATGSFSLRGGGTLHLPDWCHRQLCILTLKGSKGLINVPNQDHSLILRDPAQLVLALFDGHGENGHLSSSTVVRDLPFRFVQPAQAAQKTPSHFTHEFLAVDSGPVSKIPYAGSTGIVVHYDVALQHLVVASVGDSTCLIVRGSGATMPSSNSSQILLESMKHKPALPDERQRIESKGGRIFVPQNPQVESSRVLIPGPFGPESYALAMSRSLGDIEGKRLGYLTAEPDVKVLDLKGQLTGEDFVFAVVASDGVFDVINKQTLVQELDRALRSDTLPETCSKLINQAVEGWRKLTGGAYRDDITLLVTKLPMR
jgi:serine/threonine protein phosphatase PrpC